MPFKKGQSGNPTGKPKGATNHVNRELKLAILVAAELVGDKLPGGAGGLVGYLQHLARSNESAFATLLGKVLPLQVSGEEGGPVVIKIVRFSEGQDSDGA